jgi:methyl-accepting chemotaxis protein
LKIEKFRSSIEKFRSSLTIVLITVIALCLLGGYSVVTTIGLGNTALTKIHEVYMDQFDQQTKQEVQTAVAILDEYQQKEALGQLSEKDAQKQAADIIRGMKYGKEGYFWIDTTKGMNIVNLGKSTEGNSRWDSKDSNGVYYIQEIIKNGSNEGGGYTEYSIVKAGGTIAYPKRSYSVLFKSWDWVIGTGNYYDDIDQIIAAEESSMQKATTQRMVIILALSLIALIVNLLIAGLLNRKTQKDVQRTTEYAQQLAEGDLTIQHYTAGGEMKAVSNALFDTTESLRRIISNIKESMTQIDLSTEGLSCGTRQSAEASIQVTSSIREVANMLENQLHTIEEIAAQMEQVSADTISVEQQSKEAMNRAKTSELSAQNGKQALDHAIEQMGQIQASVEQTAQVVTELEQRSQEIGKINDTIKTIAEQTNLLALNAAIEAARAGEHGKGFSVVADEVRKLADGSSQAAQQIAELIKTIQNDTLKVNQSMHQSINEVTAGYTIMTKAGASFVEITDHVQEVSAQIQEIVNESSEIQQAAKRVAQSTKDMLKQNSFFSTEAQSISAATEQQTASAEEMASTSQVLADMTSELHEMIKKFKV